MWSGSSGGAMVERRLEYRVRQTPPPLPEHIRYCIRRFWQPTSGSLTILSNFEKRPLHLQIDVGCDELMVEGILIKIGPYYNLSVNYSFSVLNANLNKLLTASWIRLLNVCEMVLVVVGT